MLFKVVLIVSVGTALVQALPFNGQGGNQNFQNQQGRQTPAFTGNNQINFQEREGPAFPGGQEQEGSDSGASGSADTCWPQGQYTLLQAAEGCPASSWRTGYTVHYMNKQSKLPTDMVNGSVDGRFLKINYCSHEMNDAQPGCQDSPAEFPPGSYCIYQHGRPKNGIVNANCPVGFKWSWLALDEINGGNVSHGGALPLGEYFSFATVPYFCCREDGDPEAELTLPNKHAFVLFPTSVKKTCQKVAGMTEQKSEIFYDSSDDSASDNGAPSAPDYPPPEYYIDLPKGFFGKGMRIAICHYNPDLHGGKNSQGVSLKLNHPVPLPARPSAPATCWPRDNFVLYKPKSGCPDGWSEGSVRHTLLPNSRIAPSLDSTLVEDGVISNYCAHEGTDADRHCSESNTAKWSRGSYCIAEGTIKEGGIIDKSCPEGFEYSWFVIDDVTTNNRNEVNGSVPEGEYYNHCTVYYLCCRDDGKVDEPIQLPTSHPFVLLPNNDDRKCQAVAGMSSTYETMFYDSEDADSDFIPIPPKATYIDYVIDRPKGAWGAGANVRICHYTADLPPRSALMNGGRGSMNGGGGNINGNNNDLRGGNNNMPNRNQGGSMSNMNGMNNNRNGHIGLMNGQFGGMPTENLVYPGAGCFLYSIAVSFGVCDLIQKGSAKEYNGPVLYSDQIVSGIQN